jgi:hypothetical protein
VPAKSASPAGRIVHDERGNAIWDWVKDTARNAIDSTSRVLRRLDLSELKLDDPSDGSRSGHSRESGYDPYGNANSVVPRPTRSGQPEARGGRGRTAPDPDGGYDPYGKGVTRKARPR